MFRASRLSAGNHLFPTQVLITPTSVVQYTPRWIGAQEETIHMAHVASVKIDTRLLLSDVLIETSGGTDPIRCHGHRKGDAVQMKALIEQYQTDYYRGGGPADLSTSGLDRPITLNATMDDLTFSARRASAAAAAETAEPADLDARFRTLVQSPLRAGILRYLSARPDESFDVESLMQTFGRLRLDVENCVRELVDFGVATAIAGARRRGTWRERPANEALADLLDHFLERRAHGQHRGSVAVGPALPRNDRPRREDADRLRVDPHGRQVRHLGARSSGRPDRARKSSRG